MFNTLKSRILAGFFFVLALLVGLGGYSIMSLRSLSEVAATGLQENSEIGLSALAMNASLDRINAAQSTILAGGEIEEPSRAIGEEISQYYIFFQRARAAAENISPTVRDTVGSILTQVELSWERYQATLNEQFLLNARRDPRRAAQVREKELQPAYEELRTLHLSLAELNTTAFQQNRKSTLDKAQSATLGVLLVALSAVAVGLIGAFLITRRTVQPLKKLTDTVKALQAGHLNARVPVTTADEFGDLGYEFNRLTERLEQFEAIRYCSSMQKACCS
jgi:HAMP domain-containing protein